MTSQPCPSPLVASLDLGDCPLGPVLEPLADDIIARRRFFQGWETPLAPQGVFNLGSGLAVCDDAGRHVLEWQWPPTPWHRWDRALLAGTADWRDYRVTAEVKALAVGAEPHEDRATGAEAHVGIAFRVVTSRQYYLFALEGRRRAVLYRRCDDDWHVLAEQPVAVPDQYVTLDVVLDGDDIRCVCESLGIRFHCTDNTFPTGKAGVRALGPCRLAELRIVMDAHEQRNVTGRRSRRERREHACGNDVPSEVLVQTFDLASLGGMPAFSDFARAGRFDMLVAGRTTRAMSIAGDVLWEIPEPVYELVASSRHTPQGRLLYGLAGTRSSSARVSNWGASFQNAVADEMCVISGADGRVLARRRLPELESPVQRVLFSAGSGNLTGDGGFDIVLREWRSDAADGGFNLWAYNRNLELLWQHRVRVPYGHQKAIAFFDVDGDGRDEVLAGGTLLSHEGLVLWEHDLAEDMARIRGAQHYDTVAVGNFADDPALDPVAFLLGSAAGVYVVDARTGRTRVVHRCGHAQDHSAARFRSDIPGTQIHVVTRWGNMGIQTLFAGNGARLWTIQPDYFGQGCCPVSWDRADVQRLWVNTNAEGQGLYDGCGQRIKDLPALRELHRGHAARDVSAFVARMGTDPRERLCLTVGGTLHALAAATCRGA